MPDVFEPLGVEDHPALVSLMRRCLERDGGLPAVGEPDFVHRLFLSGQGVALRDSRGRLRAAVAAAPVEDGRVAVTGAVDPDHRDQGLGAALLDWAEARAAGHTVLVRSENLNDEAHALFTSRGYEPVLREFVLRRPVASRPVVAELPASVTLESWSSGSAPDFYAAYTKSFGERPGFPGWSFEQWTRAMVDEDLNAEASVVARDETGTPVGFVLIARDWVEQVGVVPERRRSGLGTALVARALDAIASSGVEYSWLSVAENNEPAITLYQRRGFEVFGRRGRYQRDL